MLNRPIRKIVRTTLAPQPGSPLTGEDKLTLRVASIGGSAVLIEIVVKRSSCHIVQIQRASFTAFAIDNGNRPGSLVDIAALNLKRGNFANPQPCPVTQSKNGSQPFRVTSFHQHLEYIALIVI